MKNYEGIMCIENIDLKGLVVEESLNSLIVTVEKTIFVPDKRIFLIGKMTEQEFGLFMSANKNKGGTIV